MPRVLIAGGGLAGIAAAAALGGAGFDVDLYEARGFLGGRATSYPVPGGSEVIDNCQHVLLACFTNLLNLYERLGVRDRIRFYREFRFIEPGGRVSVLKAGALPAPAHFLGSFARLPFLGVADKVALACGMRALGREAGRTDLDRITMLDWLRQHGQTPRAISRFWSQVLVSAINEDLDRMAACHGFQVFRLAFLGRADAHYMGLSAVPLGDLYAFRGLARTSIHTRAALDCFRFEDGRVVAAVIAGEDRTADYYVSALPFERAAAGSVALEHSPITGIHLWFDRPVMDFPHATLLDRTIQWAFDKGEGRYVQLVVSASRSLAPLGRQEVIDLALRELAEFFPKARGARLEKAHVVKEMRATFSATPQAEALRPPARTAAPNLFLAGDWTRTGWPATMEGAVRSGYLAAEAIAEAAGRPERFVLR